MVQKAVKNHILETEKVNALAFQKKRNELKSV